MQNMAFKRHVILYLLAKINHQREAMVLKQAMPYDVFFSLLTPEEPVFDCSK